MGRSKKCVKHHCGVPQCKTYRGPGTPLFCIPKYVRDNPVLLMEWSTLLGMSKKVPNQFLICSKHFDPKSILIPLSKHVKISPTLLKSAFPCRNLPILLPSRKEEVSGRRKRSAKQTRIMECISNHKHRKVGLEEPTELAIDDLPNLKRQSEIAFEYVEIKEEPTHFISTDEPMSLNSSINIPKPFNEIKIEPKDSSSRLITLCSPSPLQNSCKMIDQACQTEEAYVPDATENYKDELITILKRENGQLKERLMAKPSHSQIGKIPIETLKGQNKKVNFLTGLPNFRIMEIIYKDVANYIPFAMGGKISKFDVFLMTWMKLEMDLSLNFLSILMDINTFKISELFFETFVILYNRLNKYIVWPDGIHNPLNTPPCYKQIFGEGRFIIIDFFEIYSEQVNSKNNLTSTSVRTKETIVQETAIQNSKPKSERRPMKYLISFSTAGTIIYISKPFDTALSNDCIAKQSGFLDNIDADHIILANREFLSVDKTKSKGFVPMVKNVDGELVEIIFEVTAEFTKIREDIGKKILFAKSQILMETNRTPVLAVINKYGEDMYSEFVLKLACSVVNLMVLNTDIIVMD